MKSLGKSGYEYEQALGRLKLVERDADREGGLEQENKECFYRKRWAPTCWMFLEGQGIRVYRLTK